MQPRELSVSQGERELRVRLAGTWHIGDGVPLAAPVTRWLSDHAVARVAFDGRGVVSWDSSLVSFVHDTTERLAQLGVPSDLSELPGGVQRLLALASTSAKADSGRHAAAPARPPLEKLGGTVLDHAGRIHDDVALLGEVTAAVGRFVTGRARTRLIDVVAETYQAGAQALPIVTLVSALLGAIMAFVGAAALKPFGAGIYVANVVSIAMLRELSATMTAIVMAGRTGSSYGAQLATMNLTQELDALETMGIGTVDFLLLPRILALSIMLPLLCVYANFVGIAGGAVVAVSMLDLSPVQYVQQTRAAVTFTTFMLGVGKGAAFGVLVAFLGCRAGLRSGRGAAAVGRAATAAMVTAIVAIIVADGAFAVIFQVIGV